MGFRGHGWAWVGGDYCAAEKRGGRPILESDPALVAFFQFSGILVAARQPLRRDHDLPPDILSVS